MNGGSQCPPTSTGSRAGSSSHAHSPASKGSGREYRAPAYGGRFSRGDWSCQLPNQEPSNDRVLELISNMCWGAQPPGLAPYMPKAPKDSPESSLSGTSLTGLESVIPPFTRRAVDPAKPLPRLPEVAYRAAGSSAAPNGLPRAIAKVSVASQGSPALHPKIIEKRTARLCGYAPFSDCLLASTRLCSQNTCVRGRPSQWRRRSCDNCSWRRRQQQHHYSSSGHGCPPRWMHRRRRNRSRRYPACYR